MLVTVKRCARCGQDHEDLNFERFKRPCMDCTHWGVCPTTGEPILLGQGEKET